MTCVDVFHLLQRRALVTRGSAREIRDAVDKAGVSGTRSSDLDFGGVEALSPSFIDELIAVWLGSLSGRDGTAKLVLTNVPTRLSSKFEAIGRGRGVEIVESEPGTWEISKREAASGR